MAERCSFVAGIDQPVLEQIKVREEKFGKSPKTDRELMIIHGNCPWVVLRSGIDAPVHDPHRWKVFPRTKPERCAVTNDWAKKTVLGGELQNRSGDGNFVRPHGIQTIRNNNQNLLDSAYYITEYQGHRPVAGITEVTVTSLDEWGMILEATIKIKCWSVDDLDKLDRVYFKPGYSALLEWGHTLYFRRDGTECITPSQMIPDDTFFARGNYLDLDATILRRRKEDSNREAMFGYITNFSYSLNKDGSYDCSVKMLSKGSIIKGLKIKGTNQWADGTGTDKKDDELKQEYQMISTWHRIHQAFIDFAENKVDRKSIDAVDKGEGGMKDYSTLPSHRSLPIKEKDLFFDGKQALEEKVSKETNDKKMISSQKDPYFTNAVGSNKIESFPVIALPMKLRHPLFSFNRNTNENRQNHEFYITLRSLLHLANVFESEGGRIRFNLWDTSEYANPEGDDVTPNPSLNPFIAVKPEQGNKEEFKLKNKEKNFFNDLLLEKDKGPNRILDIWINFDMFLLEIEHQINGQVENYSFFEALQNLLGRIQKAFGNINEFQIVADHKIEDNLFTIIDNKCIYINSLEEVPEIQVTGLKNTITDLKVTSEVSSDIANQMSIAAQAPRTYEESSENADESMIHWGENCENRWILPDYSKKTSDSSSLSKAEIEALAKKEEIYKNNKEQWKKTLIKNYASIQKGVFVVDKIEGEQSNESKASEAVLAASEDMFSSLQLNGEAYMQELAAREVPCSRKPGLQMGIIPIRVGLTMMGIGNLTIGNVFRIKSAVVPKKYRDWGQIITGIEHHISKSGWTTTLKTQYYPLYYGDNTVQPDRDYSTQTAKTMEEGVQDNIEVGRSTNYEALQNACGMQEAYKATEYTYPTPGKHGCCARYTYSWARAFVKGKEALTLPADTSSDFAKSKGIAAPPGINGGGVGNANQEVYENNLRSLGYKEQEVKTGMTPAQITQYANTQCSTGDVLIYYPVDENGNAYKNGPYGHTQFFTGTQWVSDFPQASGYSNKASSKNQTPANYKLVHLKAPQRHSDWNCSA